MNSFQNPTTIKNLAEKLGLSKGTVSKALKDSHEISAATKTKVMEAASELRYMPNHFASGLKSRKSKTIAVIVPEIVDSFFSLAINGIETITQNKGYHINIYITHDLISKEKEIIKALCDGRVDGVLISICREGGDNNHIKALIGCGIPLVFFDRVADDLDCGKVLTDDFEGGYQATRHLIKQECNKIFFLSICGPLSILRNRMDGFLKALNEASIQFPRNNVYKVSAGESNRYEAIKSLLSSADTRPDGIVISVESLTIPVYTACRDLNIHIPGDLKLICFSNLLYASLLSPSLTTMTQPAFEIGQHGARLLCDSIEKFRIGNHEPIICPSQLDIRQSSCA